MTLHTLTAATLSLWCAVLLIAAITLGLLGRKPFGRWRTTRAFRLQMTALLGLACAAD
jgi:hypothetical protein